MFNTVKFPLELTINPIASYRRNGDKLIPQRTGTDVKFLEDSVKAVISDNANIQLPESQWKIANETGMSFGSPDAGGIPAPLVATYKSKQGFVFPDFEIRKAAGEIMVSDYSRVELRVSRSPGLKFKTSKGGGLGSLRWHALVRAGLCSHSRFNGKDIMTFPNGIIIGASPGSFIGDYRRVVLSDGAWEYPPVVSPEEIAGKLFGLKPDPTELVTDVTAKANTASLDVLTSMAEMPEAVKSIIAGLKVVVTLLKDVKRGEFLVKNKFGAKKRDLNLIFHRDVKRLKQGLKDPNLSPARKKALQERMDFLNSSHSRSMLSIADELASALADIWLNFRYNIMPNVYLAQDVYDAMEKYRIEYVTSRGFFAEDVMINVPNMEPFPLQIKTSAVIRRNFSADSAGQGAGVISNDLFVTAWELVPLSFVIDWFLNIGDVLSAMSYNPSWSQEGATLATAVKDINLRLFPSTPYAGFQINPVVTLNGFVYERTVIDPTSLCGLVWKPSVGLARQVDAVALLWRPVRSLFINMKR